jgi:hypothetical protein
MFKVKAEIANQELGNKVVEMALIEAVACLIFTRNK